MLIPTFVLRGWAIFVRVSGIGPCQILQHPAEISEVAEFVSAAPWLFRAQEHR